MENDVKTWLLPHDDEMESTLVGTLMQLRDALPETRHLLTPDCFYNSFYRRIFTAILAIDGRGEEPDLLTVHHELKNQGETVPVGELALVSAKRSFVYVQHAAKLRELAAMRKAFYIGYKLMTCASTGQQAGYPLIEATRQELNEIYRQETDTVTDLDGALTQVHELVKRNLASNHSIGAPTGFREFDKHGGLWPGHLLVIGADTSAGKTSLAVNMTIHAARSGCGVSFYSLEMNKEELAARMIAMEGGLSSSRVMFKKLGQEELSHFDRGVAKLLGLPVYFDDRSYSNIEDILLSIRYMKVRYDIRGVVVDFLQILSVNTKNFNREQQLAEAARRLKNIAKELGVWVLALSQLNRDKSDPLPSMSRLRDSAQIADAADVVMLLYRAELYGKKYPEPFAAVSTQGTALVNVAKGRSIGTFQFMVGFDPNCTRFYELPEAPRIAEPRSPVEEEDPF